ncbi:MAG: carboxypeptidase regulatory-like domain-containing protein [Cognaticolwellia sp.]
MTWLVSGILFVMSFVAKADASTVKLGHISGKIALESHKHNLNDELENIVIFIEGENLSSSHVNHHANEHQIPQVTHKGRQFAPRVLPIVRGDNVDFFNDDSIYHNVFSLSKVQPFDLGIYPENTSKLVRFEKTGLVKLYCNIHPQMTSNILVLNNDYYTTANSDGSFSIKNIPVGRYVLRVWHELAEAKQYPIEVKAGENVLDKLFLTLTKRYIQHKNKFGKHYKSKY